MRAARERAHYSNLRNQLLGTALVKVVRPHAGSGPGRNRTWVCELSRGANDYDTRVSEIGRK